jgi:hypothetical protein
MRRKVYTTCSVVRSCDMEAWGIEAPGFFEVVAVESE